MKKILKLLNHPTVKYIIAGGCTTAVNFIVFTVLDYLLHINVNIANIISIICSVLFAYVANKIYVFNSRTDSIKALAVEFAKFVGARGITMVIEVGGVFVLDLLHWNGLAAKFLTQVIVLVTNYIFSKIFVFKDKGK